MFCLNVVKSLFNLNFISEVDYEKQKSYSLSMEARDGGGRVSTVSLLISLSDVNDNPPEWELSQYQRTVREGATVFQPQFFIRVSFCSISNILSIATF